MPEIAAADQTKGSVVSLADVSVKVDGPAGKTEILALDGLCIEKNSSVALVGPSGSGKTTLLNVISGMQPVSSGKAEVLGRALETMTETERDHFRARNIGMVFQSFNLLPGLTALENVMLGMMISGKPIESDHARKLLEDVGLKARIDHYPGMLSTGERQRVAVARAVAHSPAIILADEPTGSLDQARAAEVVEILFEVSKRLGCTLIVVTHDMTLAARFASTFDLRQLNRAQQEKTG